MEHIVQFAIGIDDNAIVKNVSENAEKEIINDLKQKVANRIFQHNYYNKNADPDRDPLTDFAKGIITSVIEDNKDVIIEKAAEHLAERLSKTKKGKEILDNLKE